MRNWELGVLSLSHRLSPYEVYRRDGYSRYRASYTSKTARISQHVARRIRNKRFMQGVLVRRTFDRDSRT